jgi:curved DNA-binding protein CbpA
MRTLYDLLGARPADDAEGLTNAFRKAAEAYRAGVRARNPDATKRFRHVVEAYDILRDEKCRATYDRRLEFERGKLYSKLSRIASCLLHNIVSDAVGVVGLAVVLAGGHTLIAYMSRTPINAVEASALGPAEVTSIQRETRTGLTGPEEPRDDLEATVADTTITGPNGDVLAANDGGTLEAQEVGPASIASVPNIEAAKTDNTSVAAVDQDQVRPSEVPFSSQEKESSVQKSSLADFPKSDHKLDIKRPDPHNINAHDVKIREMKITGKLRFEATGKEKKKQAPIIQASLENRKTLTCPGPQACSGNVTPLFGIGF